MKYLTLFIFCFFSLSNIILAQQERFSDVKNIYLEVGKQHISNYYDSTDILLPTEIAKYKVILDYYERKHIHENKFSKKDIEAINDLIKESFLFLEENFYKEIQKKIKQIDN